MKNKILLFSLTVSALATVLALWGIIQQPGATDVVQMLESNLPTAANYFITSFKLYQISGCLGLLGISSFFVGLVYPKDVEVSFKSRKAV